MAAMFLPYTTDLVTALGWAILHSIWQALLIFGCLRIVLKLWPAATASTKYNLSFISLAGIFGWFVVTLYQQLDAATPFHTIASPATAAASPVLLNMPAVYQRQQELNGAFPNLEFCFPILVALYMAGVGVMCIKLFADLAQLQQIRKQQGLPADTAWEQYLRKLSKQLQIPRKVKLLVSQHIQVPVMMGFLKPVILVPIAMFNNLSAEQLEAILLHELAHVKRNDYILNIFQSIVETTLFFNPFVWWISKYIRLEREHCCDDMVIAHTVQPLHYAKALVALEEYRFTTNPMAMAAADNKQHLFYRIKRIMEMKTSHLNYSQKLMAVLIIAVGLTAIAWITPSAARQDNKATATAGKPVMPAAHTTTPANQDTVPAKNGTPAPVPTPTTTDDRDSKADTPAPGSSAGQADFDYDNDQDKDMKAAKEKMDAAQEQMIIAQKAMQQAMKNIDWKKINEETAKAMKNVDWNQINKNVNDAMKNVDWKKINAEVNAAIKESQQSWDPEVINQSVQLGLQSAKEAMASINLEEIIKNSMQEAQEGIKKGLSPEERESIHKEIAAARKEARKAQEEALKEVRKETREAGKKAREQMDYARADATTARKQADVARHQAEVAKRKAEVTRARYSELVKKMAADNLLDPNKAYSIEKKNGQLYINGTQQPGAVMDKYRPYLSEGNSIILKGEKDNLSINIQD